MNLRDGGKAQLMRDAHSPEIKTKLINTTFYDLRPLYDYDDQCIFNFYFTLNMFRRKGLSGFNL